MIHHELWTQASYCRCHGRAVGAVSALLLCLSDGSTRKAERQRWHPCKSPSGEKIKTAEFGSVCLQTCSLSSISDSDRAKGGGEPDER